MRTRCAAPILVLALTVVVEFGLTGTVSPKAGCASAADPPRMNAGLATMLGTFELRVVGGRIEVGGAASFQNHKGEFKNSDLHERLELTHAGRSTTLHYELTTPQAQLTWDLLADNEVRVRRLPRSTAGQKNSVAGPEADAGARLVIFSQPTQGPLTLSVGEGAQRKALRGATLWHLFLAEPGLCGDELAPLLQVMKPGWNLVQTAQANETLLFRAADAARQQPRRDEWLRLVADLGHEKFSRRQAAERRLCLTGGDALPFLLSLDQHRLDAEQRARVRAVIGSLTGHRDGNATTVADSPDRIVRLLLDDPGVWLALLNRDDEEQRRIAARHLSRLLKEAIDFDPAADESKRQQQIRELRRRAPFKTA